MAEYAVAYTASVVDFMMNEVTSERVYDKIDRYREILSSFPEIGHRYEPMYDAARPPFPTRVIAVPDTPFTLYYTVDDDRRCVVVFFIEHQRGNPRSRFKAALPGN